MKNTPLFILNTREKSRRACCSDVSQENGRIFLQANRAGKGVDDSCSFKRLFNQQNFIAQPYFIRSNSIVFFKSEPRVTDAIYKIKDCSKRRTPLLSQRTKTPYQNCHVKLEQELQMIQRDFPAFRQISGSRIRSLINGIFSGQECLNSSEG